jgi:hypothetical protein
VTGVKLRGPITDIEVIAIGRKIRSLIGRADMRVKRLLE